MQKGYTHGTVIAPPSRVWTCFQENPESPDSPACITSVADFGTQHLYDWASILQGQANENHQAVVPNGNLASGGKPEIYGGMDQVRSDWVKTDVTPGPYEVVWNNSAPHATEYYRVYITTLLVETPFRVPAARDTIDVVLPNRTGHHVIYSVWQRSDSPEAFYSASDVDFGGGGGDQGADDKNVLINDNLEIANDLKVNTDIFFPNLANGQIQNLTIDANGKVMTDNIALQIANTGSTSKAQVHTVNKYNFSNIEQKGEAKITREGIHFKHGSKLKGVDAMLLDNNEDEESISLRIYRISKTSKISSPELILLINGTNTKKDTFESFSSESIVTQGSENIDNEKYIYYAEVSLCEVCDFTEVRFIFD